INFPSSGLPNLRSSCLIHLWVCRVLKLLENVRVRHLCCQLICLLDCTFHAQKWIGKDQLGTEGLKNDPPFHAHGCWHCQD
ncbi:Os03g0747850, partial [Oryza sativa Japonica Group]